MARKQRIYKVLFTSNGQLVELYARQVTQGSLFGFIEVEDLIFGARSQVVVDPGEESLRHEFGEAKRLFLPLHAIVRIDEVEREGTSRMRAAPEGASTVRPFPIPVVKPGDPPHR
ncbi:MAG: DUF1820 family protein [Holophagales bacterium]|jgi:hypothetical protein|nr:MAG: DUF1820 family protein [Holophagales bacterium]